MTSLSLRPAAQAQMAKTVQLAMMDFLAVLCSMPHMSPDSWKKPPQGGWTGVATDTLRERGKTDAAIDFVRQLPCIRRESAEPLPLTPQTTAIDFSNGETVPECAENLIDTPEHVIWFGNALSHDGHYLLLDTLAGTITEFHPQGITCRLSSEEYEALPAADRWMAHETLSAQSWFDRERLRLERLVYMPLPLAAQNHPEGESAFLFRAETLAQEQDLLDMEEELDDDEDFVDDGEVESEDEDEDDAASYGEERDGRVVADEWQELVADNRAKSQEPTGQLADSVRETIISKFQPSLAAIPRQPTQSEEAAQKVADVFDIYRRSGWGSGSFNRQRCRDELLTWAAQQAV